MSEEVRNGAGAPMWCLEVGIQRCGFCASPYHAEAFAFCVRCDSPVCPLCLVLGGQSHEVLCPDCREETGP